MIIVIFLLAIILCVCLFGKNKEPLGDESVQNGTAMEEPVAEQSEKQESEQSYELMAEQSAEQDSEQLVASEKVLTLSYMSSCVSGCFSIA